MAILVTIADAVLAFPIAYYMARIASPRSRNLLVVAVLTPLWASYLVKAYAWRTILGQDGVLNWLLAPFGLSGPGYSSTGLWLAFTYLWLPFMILPIYASLEKLDPTLLEAAETLGATPLAGFRRITLPLSLPGVVAGCFLVFIPAMGSFLTSDLLGGAKQLMIGNLIQNQFAAARNWPFGSAASFVVTALVLVAVTVYLRVRDRAVEGTG